MDKNKNIINDLSESMETEDKLNKIVSRKVHDYITNPSRELSDNEKSLIQKTTKKYNVTTLILTAITAISIGTIATLYTSLINSRAENRIEAMDNTLSKKILEFEKIINDKSVDLSAETEESKKEIKLFVKENEGEIAEVIDEFDNERKNIAETRGEFRNINKDLSTKLESTKKSIEELERLINKTSEVEIQLRAITDGLEENKRLLNILENPNQQLTVSQENGSNFMLIGELLIQWGNGRTPNSGGKGRIELVRPLANIGEVSIAITPQFDKVKAIAEIVSINKNMIEFSIYNAEVKRNYGRNDAPYSYILTAQIEPK
jgi:chromosome segregation ATPase